MTDSEEGQMATEGKTDTTYLNGEPIEASPSENPQLEDVERQVAKREWHVKGDFEVTDRDGNVVTHTFDRTYSQEPLSYTAMMQFTSLVSDRLAEAMAGPDGMTIEGLVDNAGGMITAARSAFRSDDFAGVDALVQGLAKLATYFPTVFEDCQCIWLRVPLAERPMVKEIWARSPVNGGLSIADGDEMLSVFLEQNYEELEDFFLQRLAGQVRRISKLRTKKRERESALSPQSKPSSSTAPPTLSQ